MLMFSMALCSLCSLLSMLVLTSSEHKSTIEVDGIVISFGVISHKFWPNDDDDDTR